MYINSMDIIRVGIILILVGSLILFAGFLSLAYKTWENTTSRWAGGVMIGPFPIFFGSDVKSIALVQILAIVLIVLALVLFLIT